MEYLLYMRSFREALVVVIRQLRARILSFANLNVLQQPADTEFKARRRLTPRLLKLIKSMTVRKWLTFKRLSCIKYCAGLGASFGNFVKGGSNGQV